MVTELARKRFTVQQYHQMLEVGLLREGEPIELIRGEIVYKQENGEEQQEAVDKIGNTSTMIIGRRQAACVKRLNALFHRYIGNQAIVSIQDPVAINRYSEPQPDVCLLKPQSDFYESNHPQATDIFLLDLLGNKG
uniref:Uncharacterized protein n=1 Tax=Cyanothece sp. (strain PCC 7425 / ATCC 29141) TaxID=395961 RepID=B8HL15_CYAP4